MELISRTWALLLIILLGLSLTRNKDSSRLLRNILMISAFCLLTFVAGFRENFIDTFTYRRIYEDAFKNPNFIALDYSRLEIGFRYVVYLLNLISKDSQLFVLVTSFIVNFFVFKGIKKHSVYQEFSLYFFFVIYFLSTLNVIRQALVAAIVFCYLDKIYLRKWKSFFILILGLSLIHKSVIVLIPMYFILNKKAFNKYIMVVIFGGLIVYLKPSLIGIIVLKLNQGNEYSHYLTSNDSGSNLIRAIVALVPVLLSLLYVYRAKVNKYCYDVKFDVLINMSAINFIIMLIATKILYFYRLSMYFGLANIVLIPLVINSLFTWRSQKITWLVTFAMYSIYNYYFVLSFGNYIYSFKLIFG